MDNVQAKWFHRRGPEGMFGMKDLPQQKLEHLGLFLGSKGPAWWIKAAQSRQFATGS